MVMDADADEFAPKKTLLKNPLLFSRINTML
jgi:hypothetical protein